MTKAGFSVASVARPVLILRHVLAPLTIFATVCVSLTAQAQVTPAPSPAQASPAEDMVRLSDQERSAILDKNTVESAAAARGEMAGSDRAKLKVHGQIESFVGSNGSRGIAGVVAVPLGANAGAVVSFESSRYVYRR